MNIRWRLILSYLALSLLPIFSLALVGFIQAKNELINGELNNLRAVSTLKESAIEDYFAHLKVDVGIAQNYYNIAYNLPVLARNARNQSSTDFIAATAILDGQMKRWLGERPDFIDIFLVLPDGNIIYSANDNRRSKVINKPLFDPGGLSFGQFRDNIKISDIFADPYAGSLTFIIGAPITSADGSFIGEVVLQMDTKKIYALALDATGLGNTGETLLVKEFVSADTAIGPVNSVVYLNPIRFDHNSALRRIVKVGDNHSIPAQLAATRHNGEGYSIDYRGKKVFAVWRYLPITGWGMVTKMDESEVVAAANRFGRLIFLVVFILIILIIIFTSLFTTAFTDPISQLIRAAEQFAKGDLSTKIIKKLCLSRDEFGRLACSFDNMAKQLSESRSNLEDKIRQRTQKLLETKTRDEALLNSIGEGVLAVDDKNKIILMNHAAERMLGWKLSEVRNKDFNDIALLVDEHRVRIPAGKRPKTQALLGGVVAKSDEYYFIRKDKSIFPVAITASPVKANNKVIGIIDVFRDVTNERLVDRAKTEFVSLASHQLRTPLSAINWYSEMLLAGDAGKLNETQHQYIKEIYGGNQRMVDLVNALLNISRIDLGTFAIEPEPTDLCEVARSVLAELQPQITKKKMIVTSECASRLPMISADPKLIRIIFQNLLTNSLKYTPEKGKVTVSISKKGKDMLIAVKDNGYGIPDSAKDKIFSKLYRADNIREHDTEGTGLGLYMVKAIVEESAGKVWFESQENVGTTFFVTLPLSGMHKKEGSKELASVN